MKLSLNQLKQNQTEYKWSDDLTDIGIEAVAEKVGSQLGAIDEVITSEDKYKGIVIVRVVECLKHSNADKLNVCKVDDGHAVKDVERDDSGLVQVVCGAPNVKAGMLAAWLPPGSVVPESLAKDPFTLEAREIRGVISNGMLASEKELALSDNHDGILEIDDTAEVGADFGETFGLSNDFVLDIENKMFTHRPDCFGIMGLARELAGIENKLFTSPEWYKVELAKPSPETEVLSLEITNELPEQVVRFSAIILSNITIGPSPLWLKIALARQGLRPINNIVDLTNYYMVLTGQPLHAYDYDKVRSLSQDNQAKIVVRNPKPSEKIELLNGKTITPRPEAIMIATDQELIGVGGVMGGAQTEVDNNTKNIIVECANFDMYSVRRTSMHNGLFTDAVTRFTKGQSPLQTLAILLRITTDIKNVSGGLIASEVIDANRLDPVIMKRQSLYPDVEISLAFINKRLGLNLTAKEIKARLTNVEFDVEIQNNDLMRVSAPFWRTDIELREDVVEEVGRLIGFDKLPLVLPRRDLNPATKDPLLQAKAMIRSKLSSYGANELLTYSFIDGALLDKAGQSRDKAFELANALRPELQYYRLNLLPSLLDKVYPNLRAGYDQFALFELGKGHSLTNLSPEGLPLESDLTALVITAADKLKTPGSAYYLAKDYLEQLVPVELEYFPLTEESSKELSDSVYEPNRAALVKVKATGQVLGLIGEFKPGLKRGLKLPIFSAGFEVDTLVLAELLVERLNYTFLSRFPSVLQDLSLKLPAEVTYQAIYSLIKQVAEEHKPDNTIVIVTPLDIYQSEKDPDHKNLTFRLSFTSDERTLTDKEAGTVLDQVAMATKSNLDADRL
jgi:phenylalanyl-tRNA synthetase beta chain